MPFERPLHLSSLLRFISAPLIVRSFAFFLALSGAAQQRRFLRRTETSSSAIRPGSVRLHLLKAENFRVNFG